MLSMYSTYTMEISTIDKWYETYLASLCNFQNSPIITDVSSTFTFGDDNTFHYWTGHMIGLVSLFNGLLTFVGYLMPKPSF